ncbi:TBC1 domain family member 15 isoform X1 [Vigna umbellata]|uniref:TBC1 domain family member 15 isoform X1 n=1 Tax=Vigna umbellata TaxID=87088 RepID=UPI001F5EAB4E|nr:TBC1 domain family member 15 isoform X1 [Vigna umbellata]
MLESEVHDLSDDADYAASQQHGSASMMLRSDSTKNSLREDAEIVFTKENVAIHPTQFASERISGRLKLIKQNSSLFMTWIPYKGNSSEARLSDDERNLYTIKAVSFTEIRSIRRHTPALAWPYIIVVLSSGLAYPPLYFYSGGVKEFLATIKQHVLLVRSEEDANVFLVNDFQNTLQRTLSSLELPRAVPIACGPSNLSVDESVLNENQGRADNDVNNGSFSAAQFHGRPSHKVDPARDLSINVLEKFSLVTKFARETTSQLFRENHSNGFSERRTHAQTNLDHHPRKSSLVEEKTSDESCVALDSQEFDNLSLVWGKPRQPPLGSGEWIIFLDSEGRVTDSEALRKRVFYGGLDHELRNEVWSLLLGYYPYESTYAEREFQKSVKKSEYENIKNQWQSISSAQAKRFTKFRERKGLIEKDVVRTDRSIPFYEGDDNPNVNILRDILLTYSFYNFDLGYCQGMSDLLSPILFVMDDESEAFWCFVALMERLGPNFNRDQNGMHSQLFALSKLVELLDSPLHNYFKQRDCLNYFFCFRWILIQFKREFEYEKTMRLWEVLWTHYPSEHLHLYLCVAILNRYRGKIIREEMDFDTLLKFINELSGHIDLDANLRDAEALCICAGENGAACIPPGTPPSLPVDDGSFYALQDEIL